MPKEFSRSRRMGAQIQRSLASFIQDEVKDPRVGMVTVSAVEVSRDLANAKVYVTVLGQDAVGARETVRVLNEAAPFLRRLLAAKLTARTTPQVRFYYDESFERGARLSSLIDQAVALDGEKQR